MKKTILFFFLLISFSVSAVCSSKKTDGENAARRVFNFNPEWRFHLGDIENAEKYSFDDTSWDVVSTPHCVKLEPAEASGCRNYQGVAWYRKHFVAPENHLTVYFEAIMGKQKIYVNGQLANCHFGGYLPIIINLDDFNVKKGDNCVIAVMADNSDDKSFPPGKPQTSLDFAYHGGIYRDVWLIAKNQIHITDPLEENKIAGGGIFVHYNNISEKSAEVIINTDIANTGKVLTTVSVENSIIDREGKVVKTVNGKLSLSSGMSQTVKQHLIVKFPHLWSPESPYLYSIVTKIKDGKKVLDNETTKIGIRSFEFRGKDGFWLNGKRYRQLVGANRHQDFAYVGNALPNSQQWRDVVRLKECGFNIIRTAHYPQDPSFMEACDELGIFIIVATPGWQFWNKNEPLFEERVLQNTREIIRRDRNHPSVLMLEPILNETRFPEDFALKSLQITKEEYPYSYRPAAAADVNSAGVRDNYDVVYGWPGDDEKSDKPKQCILTREFGELVDDWYAQNNLNRASRSWGEKPMLDQALSLAQSTEEMYRSNGQFIGGCQWHPFDHQRGYHPDPYWGGDYDAFRQKKIVANFFAAQCPIESEKDSGFIYIANEMTQFSDSDVVVFSNCDSVKLSVYDGEKSWILPVEHTAKYQKAGSMFSKLNSQFSKPLVFHGVWNFMKAREYSYLNKNWQKVNIVAEGIKGGKVICRTKKMPSRRSNKLRLYVDLLGKPLVADGSDFVVVVCEVTDDNGNVHRLAKENIRFTISGEGEIIGDGEDINANPRAVEWGSAPILVRSTMKAGKIKVHAEVQFPGVHAPEAADIVLESVPYKGNFCFLPQEKKEVMVRKDTEENVSKTRSLSEEEKQKMLQEVINQQADFGITK